MTPAQKKRFGATSLERIIVGQVNVPCKTQMTVTDLAAALRHEEYRHGQVAIFLGEIPAADQLAFADLHAIPRNHLRKLARKFSRNTCIRAVLAP